VGQVPSREQLINLLDMGIYIRNISMFILVLLYLRRSSVKLEYRLRLIDGHFNLEVVAGFCAAGSV
jgi:hypothetical protein